MKAILNYANKNEKTMGDIPSFRSVEQIFEGECEGTFLKIIVYLFFIDII